MSLSAFSMPVSDLPPLDEELVMGLLAQESSSRADNAAILEYFTQHTDLAERSAFCKHCYKQIYTYLFVDDHTVGFIRHDMYLELWEGNYLTKTAQVNLTWDAVTAKIADLIEQGRLMVPIKAAPVQQQMEQLTLTPEDSEKAGLPSHEQQVKNIDLAAEAKKWNKPIIDASGKYITEQDITDALCKGGGFEDSKFRIQQYLSAQVLPIEEDQARWLKKEYGIGGGVSANPHLREMMIKKLGRQGIRVTVPPLSACTDNAAMIAEVARRKFDRGEISPFDVDADPNMTL